MIVVWKRVNCFGDLLSGSIALITTVQGRIKTSEDRGDYTVKLEVSTSTVSLLLGSSTGAFCPQSCDRWSAIGCSNIILSVPFPNSWPVQPMHFVLRVATGGQPYRL